MSGGLLRVHGNGGHRLGAGLPGASRGMSGGEVVVAGRVGDEVAARARRGLVVVGGDTGASAGRAMIAGTLVVFGHVGPDPVAGNKRGSLLSVGGVRVPTTYRLACTYEPPFVRLLMTYLARRYGLAIEAADATGFHATASAIGDQAADSHCASFAIDQTGTRTATSTDCWLR